MSRRAGPFWRAYYGIYWLLVVGVGASVGLSVTYRAFETPDQAAPGEALSEAICEAKLMAHLAELREQATSSLRTTDAALTQETWPRFSTEWRQRLDQLRATCRLRDAAERQSLARLADDIDRMELAYTTAIKGFSDVGRRPLERIKTRSGG